MAFWKDTFTSFLPLSWYSKNSIHILSCHFQVKIALLTLLSSTFFILLPLTLGPSREWISFLLSWYVYAHVCLCVCIYVYRHGCVWVYSCAVCVCIHMCHVCACVYTCVCLCMFTFLRPVTYFLLSTSAYSPCFIFSFPRKCLSEAPGEGLSNWSKHFKHVKGRFCSFPFPLPC